MTYSTTLCRMITGTELEIEFGIEITYSFCASSGDGWNEPREDAHIEIESVFANFINYSKYKLGNILQQSSCEIDLTKEETEKMEETIMSSLEKDYREYEKD